MTEISGIKPIQTCACCGGTSFEFTPVIWPGLIQEWGLTEHEVAYINRQQGARCTGCANTLRSIALAQAILNAVDFRENFLSFIKSPLASALRILEINEAGTLTKHLARLPKRELALY